MGDDPSIEEIADGMALWQEHKPQTGEDWIAVARRFNESGGDASKSSPLFAGLAQAVAELDTVEQRAYAEGFHGAEDALAENDRLRSQLEDREHRLREIRDYGLKYEARSQHFKAIALLAAEALGEESPDG